MSLWPNDKQYSIPVSYYWNFNFNSLFFFVLKIDLNIQIIKLLLFWYKLFNSNTNVRISLFINISIFEYNNTNCIFNTLYWYLKSFSFLGDNILYYMLWKLVFSVSFTKCLFHFEYTYYNIEVYEQTQLVVYCSLLVHIMKEQKKKLNV